MNALERPAPSTAIKQTDVLLIEDSPADARFVEEMLPTSSYRLVHVTSLLEAHKCVSFDSFDVVLLDLSLPDGHGLATFLSMIQVVPTIPIVILTGLNDEDIASQAIKLGAQDYVPKDGLNDNILTRTIRYSIQRNQAEERIRKIAAKATAAEAHLKLALKASQTGVWSWEIATDKLTIDDQVLALYGLTDGGALERLENFLNCVHPDDRQRIKNALELAMNEKEDYEEDYRIIWKDGSEHHISASARGIFDANGNGVSMVGVCKDTTKQKLEQENAKRLLVLEKHEDFTATLTHDLKNPLIGAERVLQLLLTGEFGALNAEQLDALGLLRQSNSDVLALLRNLLEVYRRDAAAPPLDLTPVDIAALANNCISQLTASADSYGVRLISNFPEGSHTIPADPIAMRRVLTNLLSNGMKYTGSGGHIAVSGCLLGNSYILEVADSGWGMPQEDLESLFQKYSQGKLGKKYADGTGLGLYLCQQLVEAHKGQINCTSTVGVGTTFRISLPGH